MTQARAVLVGSGMSIPPLEVDNHMLARIIETDDAWIRERSGVVTRFYVEAGVASSDLGGLDAGVGERGAGRFGAEVRGGDSRLDVVARHDAAALADPGVVGLDDARQHVVVDLERRDRNPGSGKHGASLGHGGSSVTPRGGCQSISGGGPPAAEGARTHHGGGAAVSGRVPGRGT